jgi:CRISPR-associated protein Cas6
MSVESKTTEGMRVPVVDVSFPLQLFSAPFDHGYLLYSAISRVAPHLHEATWLGIHPLSGQPVGTTLDLGKRARLRLRLPADRVANVLPLSGATLRMDDRSAVVGAPTIHTLTPSSSLDARMVAIKLTDAPVQASSVLGGRDTIDTAAFGARYAKEIERQLAAIEIRKPFQIRGKRSLRVAGRRVIGYAVRVIDLTPDESLRLLERGIGGKRRMGCGLFRPTRGT